MVCDYLWSLDCCRQQLACKPGGPARLPAESAGCGWQDSTASREPIFGMLHSAVPSAYPDRSGCSCSILTRMQCAPLCPLRQVCRAGPSSFIVASTAPAQQEGTARPAQQASGSSQPQPICVLLSCSSSHQAQDLWDMLQQQQVGDQQATNLEAGKVRPRQHLAATRHVCGARTFPDVAFMVVHANHRSISMQQQSHTGRDAVGDAHGRVSKQLRTNLVWHKRDSWTTMLV
jgi:hypothetical protein